MSELNRRLVVNGDIVYPITLADNVIHLQKEITEKLPIISSEEPTSFVERQVWLDVSEEENGEQEVEELMSLEEEQLGFESSDEPEDFGFSPVDDEEEYSFGQEDEEQEEYGF